MTNKEKIKTMQNMIEINIKADQIIDHNMQELGNNIYYEDFKLNKIGLGIVNAYIVEINSRENNEIATNTTYHIYDKEQNLIATVDNIGKVHFTQKYLDEMKQIDEALFGTLELEDVDFELPEELEENDLVMTKEELKEFADRDLNSKTGKIKGKKENNVQETEEEKKEKSAKALGIDVQDIRTVSTINPREKITDKNNLIDFMPEARNYESISIVCSRGDSNSAGRFMVLGVDKEGNREEINSIEPIEGVGTNKDVISVNADGTEVVEKQVKGLMRINSGNRNNGLAVSINDFGMIDIDYVSNIMDKENRRATPIRTKEAQNQRTTTSKVRENAGDSLEEMEKEGKRFRKGQEKGVDPQSLDGIETDKYYGSTLEEIKRQIIEKASEKEDMSRDELIHFIKEELQDYGLELTEGEEESTVQEIHIEAMDEMVGNRERK